MSTDQTRTYNRKTSVVFRKTDEAFGGLSNMAPRYPLRVNGIRINTSEALYQACRFPHRPEVQRMIIGEHSPMTAKMKSKPYRSDSRPDWDHVRVKIMRWCLRVKLAQNWKAFSELLLSTDDHPIVEESFKDDFWGAKPKEDGTLVGTNALGRLLMELREAAKTQARESLLTVEPLAVADFVLDGRPIQTVGDGNPDTDAPGLPLATTNIAGAQSSLSWAIHYTEQFKKDIGRVPVAEASRWLEKLSYLRRNPYGKNSNAKRLKGLSAGFRLRIGSVRIIYRVLDGLNRVLLLRALPRGSAYQTLTAEGRDAGDLTLIFNSTESVREETVAGVTEPEGPEGTALIDVDELFLIGVPREFHASICSVEHEDALSAMDIPREIKLRVEDYLTAPGQTHVGRIYQLGAAESLPAIAAMDLSACSLVLDRQQQEIIERPLINGPYLIKGGPGTGKTLVALHRLREAYRQRLTESLFDDRTPYVAFLTYNRVLASTSAALVDQLIPKPRDSKVVTINFDKVVSTLAQKIGCDFRPLKDEEALSLVDEAISRADRDRVVPSEDLKALVSQFGSQFIMDEIEDFIYANGVRSLDEYLKLERVGRKTPLRTGGRPCRVSVFRFSEERFSNRNTETRHAAHA